MHQRTIPRWTKTPPTTEGYYWAINNGVLIVLVKRRNGKLVGLLPNDPWVYDLNDFEAWFAEPICHPPDSNRFDLLRYA